MADNEIPLAHGRLPDVPSRVASLPRDHRGYPVPWFVWFDEQGKPDFRIVGPGKHRNAHRFSLCWVCGKERGRNLSFVIGPMCAVNRTSGEPPCHLDCAVFSARACPFLTRPKMRRNTVTDVPEGAFSSPAGLERDPGVALVWNTRSYQLFRGPKNEPLYHIGDPDGVLWFCEGRPATRAEVLASIESGLPLLHSRCEQEATPDDRARAHTHLVHLAAQALALVPP